MTRRYLRRRRQVERAPVSPEAMRESLKRVMELRGPLQEMDAKIARQIVEIEGLLWDKGFRAFESGDYSYHCRKGRWR